MVNQSKLSRQAEELKSLVHDWIPKRKETVSTLQVSADELMVHHINVCRAQVAGSSVSIVGFGFLAAAFGLSFVTGGASLIPFISAVGGGIGAAGAVTSAGSLITEVCIQKDTFDTAQKIIDEDQKATEAIQKLLEKFGKTAQKCIKEKGSTALFKTATMAYNVVVAFKAGSKVGATAASEGGEALFRGLSKSGKMFHIGSFLFSAVMLPLDIYALVTNWAEIDAFIKEGKTEEEPAVVKQLRKLADDLAISIPDENEFARQLDDFVFTVTATESQMEMIC